MKAYTIVGLAAVGALALSACTGGGGGGTGTGPESGGEPVIDGTLNYAIARDPGMLFSPLNASGTLGSVSQWAYESLIYFDADGQPQGWLATDWEQTPTSLHFEVRDDAVCADGTKLTAETIANNFRWIADPANNSTAINLVVPSTAKIENDDKSVTITTVEPDPFMITAIGSQAIYCQAALDDPQSVSTASNGTGMFNVTEVVTGDHLTLERRDDYSWAPEGAAIGTTPGVPKTVVLKIIENESTRANLLLSGELNVGTITGPDGDRLEGKVDVLNSGMLLTGGFLYSQAEGRPTADKNVRIALTKALDLDELMQVSTAGKGERAQRLATVDPQVCQYDAVGPNLPKTDVAGAEKLLDEAGWVKGADGKRSKDGQPLVLEFAWQSKGAEIASTAEMMADQWAEIGVGVNHDGSEYGAFIEKISTPGAASKIDVMWLNANYPVPSALMVYFTGETPPKGNNFAALKNPKFDELVKKANNSTGAEGCKAWEAAEGEMYASADYVPFAMMSHPTFAQGISEYGIEKFAPSTILVK
ncbi:peptide/nickel transport system substrate-binding protein [Leucobacter komagatae]|uniref:Peptide/nickel transport system substrate-binding protein n=1 Tax=Leucobacter komagatae TaxID=55969 RepID=A0A542XXD7_9MICO|nr:ABC transporter substrate-binding protein [Leucobacter komagatae]TQL40497.1 peptide/nickel transport system substrate-binding protein [Leucobacter komagatae]